MPCLPSADEQKMPGDAPFQIRFGAVGLPPAGEIGDSSQIAETHSFAVNGPSSRKLSSLKPQLRALIAQMPREAALYTHGRIDRHLGRTAFIVGALEFSRLPLHTELVERLPRRVDKSPTRRQNRRRDTKISARP
jgi:hypothetical protein